MSDYLLIDGTQIPVLSELAQVVGLNEAIVLQEVYYWCKVNKREHRPTHDGYYWVYNSYPDWAEKHFPWWHKDTVRGIFTKLEKQGLLISDNFNKSKMDRTKWYRINFPALKERIEASPSVKDSLMDMGGITRPIPEDKPKRNKNGFSMEKPLTANRIQTDGIDIDLDKFVTWYFEEYARVFGIPHPNIKPEQYDKVISAFREFILNSDCNVYVNEDLEIMAESFFYHTDSRDWRINHFATPGILETRYYAAHLKGEY